MGNQIPITTSFELPDGRVVTLETGKLAAQAHGSVMVRVGSTMLLATVVSNKEAKEGQPFFPLSVDYQEKFAAAGRIPGNFFRREAKLSDYEVLICRLVDRAIRPLFPDGYMNETQVIINLISGDQDEMPDALAALAASTALVVSDINWDGPISEVRVARIDGEYVVNPIRSALANADIDIIVAASMKDVTMVEGEAKECSEADLVEAIRIGHEAIKIQCQAQLDLAQKVGEKATVKRVLPEKEENEDLKAWIKDFATKGIYDLAAGSLPKQERKDGFSAILEDAKVKLTELHGEEYLEENGPMLSAYFDKLKKEVIRNMVLDTRKRLDGRDPDEIRPIWCEVDYLPAAHGSAVFTRGETQSLTTLTLGTKQDEVLIDTALLSYDDDFILHYNFPPYSTGEVKPMRGPGRREVGHANLAGRSVRQVMPKGLPYTIRLVSDILESNGSSSMATVCASSLALMDGGVQISEQIAGIAMGLIKEGDKYAILSDILGDEDALGDMDFKVTGTKNGICGCQMDIKIDGLPYDLLIEALEQARKGRLHILGKMNEVIDQPREDYKPHAPRIVEIVIDKSFIGAVIGPGGSIIQDIQEKTGTVISIEEKEGKGFVNIASSNKESIEAALARVKDIVFVPEVGEVYDAVVRQLMPFGAFVDFKGKSGLLHVSEIDHRRVENVEDVLKEGDQVRVKLLDLDRKTGKMKLSMKALIPRPPRAEGDTSSERSDDRRSDRHHGGGRNQRGGGDRRGGYDRNRDRNRNRDHDRNREHDRNRDQDRNREHDRDRDHDHNQD